MSSKYDIGPRIGIDGEKEYRDQLSSISNSLKLLGSEMEKNIVIFDKNNDSIDAMIATSKNLEKQYDVQAKKVVIMQEALEKAKETYGENSNQVIKYQTSLNKAEAALGKTENALKDVNEKLEESKKKAQDSESAFTRLSKNTDQLEGGLSKASLAIGAFAAGIAVAIKGTEEFRTDMAKLEVNAQQAGQSINGITQELSKLQAITGETDSNIEGLSNLMQAGFTGSNLTEVVNELSGAVIKFPDTLKIESLADGLQETLATGAATGQFGELLGRMGVNLDKFNTGLDKCNTSAEKQDYVLQSLAKLGLSSTYELYRKNNEELFKAADIQLQFQSATAAMGESLTKAFVKLSPVLIPLIDGFSSLVELISKIPAPVLAVVTTMGAMIPVSLAVLKSITTVTSFMGTSANPAMIKTTIIVLGVVAALTALAAVIAVIQGRGKELQGTMQSIGNSTGRITGRIPQYAAGTSFHTGGLALVGEQGPELINMPTGSQVFTNGQTKQMLGGSVVNNYQIVIDAKNVKEFNDVVRIAENERHSKRAGFVEV